MMSGPLDCLRGDPSPWRALNAAVRVPMADSLRKWSVLALLPHELVMAGICPCCAPSLQSLAVDPLVGEPLTPTPPPVDVASHGSSQWIAVAPSW